MIIDAYRFGGGGPPGGDLYAEIMADTPWAYYQLGETAGATSAADSSGNNRHLTVINPTVTFGATALCSPGTSTDFNGAGYLTTTNNEFGAAQAAAFNGNVAMTYCFVVNPDALGSAVPIHLGDVSTSGSQGHFVELLATGAIRMQYYDTIYGWQFFDTAAGVAVVGTPSMFHVRRAVGGASTIFHNGASVASNANPPGSIGMASGSLRIMVGAMNMATPTNPLNGRLQHVAVFASALSDSRISNHFAASGL